MTVVANVPTADRQDAVLLLERRLGATHELASRLALVVRALTGRIVFSTSFGLEDQAVLHGLAAGSCPVDIFTLDTGRHFPETLETLAESERRYGLRVRVVVPDAVEIESRRFA